MAHWLLKSEPDDWSWAQQVASGAKGAEWTGIRNHTAQRHLRIMKKGELAFFYHTGKERAVVGIVKVIAEAHADSTDSAWQAIDANGPLQLVEIDELPDDTFVVFPFGIGAPVPFLERITIVDHIADAYEALTHYIGRPAGP